MYTLKILGIDDELGMREGIKRTLEDFEIQLKDFKEKVSFEVHLAETGNEAVEKIHELKPDIILLDYKLPDINGLQVLEKTYDKFENMLTIMITAYASIETAITATKQGAYDFLPKPFTPSDLKYAVRKATTQIMLSKRNKELEEEKKRIRFEFIRVLGHELKAPLNSIASYLYIAKDHTLGENIISYDNMIERCLLRLDQMNKLIVDLLDMTKIESGQKNRVINSIDLDKAITSSVELIKEIAEKRNISINFKPSNIKLEADNTEIEMLLNNLLSNAVKYNKDNGSVNINVSSNIEFVIIKVQDTGIGISNDEKNKLFKEFVRIKNSDTKNILGSGLGLSILKKIVDLYNGEIDLESEIGKGSTFTIKLKNIKK